MELTHPEIEQLLGVYALDAVSPEEADLVDVHLRDCPRCRAEVAEHREVAASLAHVGSSAPPGVWSRIAGSLEEAPPQLDMARVVSMRSRPPRRSVPIRMAAAVAAMAAAVIALLGVQVSHLEGRADKFETALQKEGLDQAVQAALLDNSARRVSLSSEDGATVVQAVVRDNGDSYLIGDSLPRLPADQTYQLWGVADDRAVSLGVLGPQPGVSAFKMASAGVTALALTTEAAGGVVSSSNLPVARGPLPVI